MNQNFPDFNHDDTQPIQRNEEGSLDQTQPLDSLVTTQPIYAEDRQAQYQPIPISRSRLPVSQQNYSKPVKKGKGCGCFTWGVIIPVFVLLMVYLLFPLRTNVLILGVDRSPEGTNVGRTDTMMLVSVIPLKPDVNLLSIPRDLWVQIPGVGENRINTAHFFAEANLKGSGPAAAVETVSQNFGIRLKYYVRFSFDGFKDMINAMGGVTVTLPEAMSGYNPGTYHLDGDQALAFARDRQSSDDFFRMQRGQMILKSAVMQIINPANWGRIPAIINSGFNSLDTNLPFYEVPRLGFAFLRAIVFDTLNSQTITREMVFPTITSEGANVLMPNWDLINPLLLEMVGE